MNESAPLSAIQAAVLEFLQDRDDAAVFGAQAVNAYVDEPRMSQDVDILALNAAALAESIRELLNQRFQIAVRIRSIAEGRGFRIYQLRQPKNRHLVDIRSVASLPNCQRLERILIPIPAELISQKVLSMINRSKTAKGMTDIADLRRLLLKFPELKTDPQSVTAALTSANAPPAAITAWHELAAQEIEPEDDDAGY